MEAELDGDAGLGRVRVAVAFVDLAGYTRFIEEEGEEEALSRVERFIDAVNESLPEDAALVKTIGDEAMVVGRDVRALLDWAVGFEALLSERPAPRIGMHSGMAIYRDGDYFGRDVNLAARVVARSRGGEVIVTDAVREVVEKADHLAFEDIGTVKLKGFGDPERLSRVTQA
jgi:adenylate cyclase